MDKLVRAFGILEIILGSSFLFVIPVIKFARLSDFHRLMLVDAWGWPLKYKRIVLTTSLVKQLPLDHLTPPLDGIAVRSPGRDGKYQFENVLDYPHQNEGIEDFDSDIIFTTLGYSRWPVGMSP